MFIVIEDLKGEALHVHHVFPIKEILFSHEDAELKEPVTTDFVITPADRDLRIEGTVETSILFRCSRCMKEYAKPFMAEFDLSYIPQPKWNDANAEIELKYDEMEVEYYDGVAFDVNVMILEQIELAMPMQYVCREDCKGLCYQCGADLNEGECLCKKEGLDSRLSVLLDFQKKKNQVDS